MVFNWHQISNLATFDDTRWFSHRISFYHMWCEISRKSPWIIPINYPSLSPELSQPYLIPMTSPWTMYAKKSTRVSFLARSWRDICWLDHISWMLLVFQDLCHGFHRGKVSHPNSQILGVKGLPKLVTPKSVRKNFHTQVSTFSAWASQVRIFASATDHNTILFQRVENSTWEPRCYVCQPWECNSQSIRKLKLLYFTKPSSCFFANASSWCIPLCPAKISSFATSTAES